MTDPFFKANLEDDANFSIQKGSSGIFWKISTVVLAIVVGVLSYMLFNSNKEVKQDTSSELVELGKDVYYSEISNKVYKAFNSYISYLVSGDNEYIKNMNEAFTKEFANKFRVIANDPELRDLIKTKKVTAATEIEKPKIIEVSKKGVITVHIEGKIIIKSNITRFRSQSRYFSATAKLVKENGVFKIANFAPQFADKYK